jgi:hypothetical protein
MQLLRFNLFSALYARSWDESVNKRLTVKIFAPVLTQARERGSVLEHKQN